MAFFMSDVAAGSDAALKLQQNMAAAPNVEQMAQLDLQQKQQNNFYDSEGPLQSS